MRGEYNAEACKERHESEERRISMLEINYKEMAEKHDAALGRIHARFDEVSKELLTRMPPWVTIVFMIMSGLITGLGVFSVKAWK